MAAREKFEQAFSCPYCKKSGVVHISENDYPFMKSLDTQIEKIEGEFKARILKVFLSRSDVIIARHILRFRDKTNIKVGHVNRHSVKVIMFVFVGCDL